MMVLWKSDAANYSRKDSPRGETTPRIPNASALHVEIQTARIGMDMCRSVAGEGQVSLSIRFNESERTKIQLDHSNVAVRPIDYLHVEIQLTRQNAPRSPRGDRRQSIWLSKKSERQQRLRRAGDGYIEPPRDSCDDYSACLISRLNLMKNYLLEIKSLKLPGWARAGLTSPRKPIQFGRDFNARSISPEA